jgi:outer membrane protein
MDVKKNLSVLELNQNNVQVLQRELEANEDRFRVGEITRTDVAQSKARLSRAISGRISAEANLQSSRAAYLKSVGEMPGTLETPPPLPPLPGSEDEALTIALGQNPLAVAARFNERAAHYAVQSEEGGLLPSVQVVGQYSKSRDTSPFSSRADEAIVTAQISVPLYEAGLQSSRIRQAKETNQQRRLEALDAERQVREEVKVSWESLREAQGRIVSSRDQVRANEIALDGVKQEASVGARTTLDVLNSEQELLDSRVSLVQAQHDQYVAAYRLLGAIGGLTAEALALPVDKYYNPDRHYKSARNSLYGWGTSDKEGWEAGDKAPVEKASHPVKWDEKMPDGDMTGKFSVPEDGSGDSGGPSMWDNITEPKE